MKSIRHTHLVCWQAAADGRWCAGRLGQPVPDRPTGDRGRSPPHLASCMRCSSSSNQRPKASSLGAGCGAPIPDVRCSAETTRARGRGREVTRPHACTWAAGLAARNREEKEAFYFPFVPPFSPCQIKVLVGRSDLIEKSTHDWLDLQRATACSRCRCMRRSLSATKRVTQAAKGRSIASHRGATMHAAPCGLS